MNENIRKRNALLAQRVIKGLESRNMSGYYAETKEEALAAALSLIPEGSTITMGGAMSAYEIGLPAALEEGNYNFVDRNKVEDKVAATRLAYDADIYLSSTNAMTEDGVLINIDGNSNRVSAIAHGPDQCRTHRRGHALCEDRLLHELQVSGYDLLPVPDHQVFKACRPYSRHSRERRPRILT